MVYITDQVIYTRKWYILFCWSWLACTDGATLSAIVYFEWSPPVHLKNDGMSSIIDGIRLSRVHHSDRHS